MAAEKKSVNILADSKSVDMSQVFEPVYKLRFKKVSDGGTVNDATFVFEGVEHFVDFEGVTLGQLYYIALGQVRITLAAQWRRMNKKQFTDEVLEGKSRVKDLLDRVTVRTVDPVKVIEKLDVSTPEGMAKAQALLVALQAKMAGAQLTKEQEQLIQQ